ncbi:outer membrane protein assembly factor BamA [candidate division KSB1 bacterium]|nr:outer membrane protein assembly factor BamA [candidate division KSB1 bacterium]
MKKCFLLNFLSFFLVLIITTLAIPQPTSKVKISKITFEGNTTFGESQLKNLILSKEVPWYSTFLFWKKQPYFDQMVLKTDLLRLKRFYESEGFLQSIIKDYAIIPDADNQKVKLKILIKEGLPTLVDSIIIDLLDSTLSTNESQRLNKKITLKSGLRLIKRQIEADKDELFKEMAEMSCPYAKIATRISVKPEHHRAIVIHQIKAGPRSTFGLISIEGNERVSKNIIQRELGFKVQDQFKFSKLAEAQVQIYKLELFQYVSITPNFESRNTAIPIQIRVKEGKPIATRFGLGYGTEEKFRVSSEISHRNFLGDARSLKIYAQYSALGFDGTMTFIQPYLFFAKLDLMQKLFYKYDDEITYNLKRGGSETSINRYFSRFFAVTLGYRYEQDKIAIVQFTPTETIQLPRSFYNKSIVTAMFRYDDTDIPLSPTRGSSMLLKFEDSGRLIPADYQYFKIHLDVRKYFALNQQTTLAARNSWGLLTPLTAEKFIPFEERFYTGGSNSNRGWGRRLLGPLSDNESPLGGNLLFEGNIEFRFKITSWLENAYFFDFGNVWTEQHQFSFGDIRSSAGTGIRWYTPIGPIRFDLAFKNAPYFSQNIVQFHLSIGQAF